MEQLVVQLCSEPTIRSAVLAESIPAQQRKVADIGDYHRDRKEAVLLDHGQVQISCVPKPSKLVSVMLTFRRILRHGKIR